MIGDATLFQRADSVIAGWQIVQPILDYWANDPAAPLTPYAAGSEGSAEASVLLQSTGRSWKSLL
jgi:glucose-6-phosphate 1-dehydrogenase